MVSVLYSTIHPSNIFGVIQFITPWHIFFSDAGSFWVGFVGVKWLQDLVHVMYQVALEFVFPPMFALYNPQTFVHEYINVVQGEFGLDHMIVVHWKVPWPWSVVARRHDLQHHAQPMCAMGCFCQSHILQDQVQNKIRKN